MVLSSYLDSAQNSMIEATQAYGIESEPSETELQAQVFVATSSLLYTLIICYNLWKQQISPQVPRLTSLSPNYNIASRATQSNSVTYACPKSRWCTLTLMAWANRFARNFFFRARRSLLAWGKIFRYFATIMDRNRDSTHQSQNEDNFRPFLLG